MNIGDAVSIREAWAAKEWHYGIGVVVYKKSYEEEGTYFGVRWHHDVTWHRSEELEVVSEYR